MDMAEAQTRTETRARLLDAARDVIRANGYAGSTVDDICTAAGVSKGSFFHYFDSKEELGIAALERFGAMAATLFAAAPYQAASDPRDRVFGYVDFRISLLRGEIPLYTCLIGTTVQEAYATHPNLRATSPPRKPVTRPARPGTRKASATSCNACCKAPSSSPKPSKRPRSPPQALATCGIIW